MQPPSAKQFWELFVNKMTGVLVATPASDYSNYKRWTKKMTETLCAIGRELGYDPNYEVVTEYYQIDVGYYWYNKVDDTKLEKIAIEANKCYPPWDFHVAIEHENSHICWVQEFTKLCHIACGLKIIITYHDWVKQQSLDGKKEIIKTISNRLKYKYADSEWLFIIGPLNNALQEKPPMNCYTAFKFDGREITDLTGSVPVKFGKP